MCSLLVLAFCGSLWLVQNIVPQTTNSMIKKQYRHCDEMIVKKHDHIQIMNY